MKRAGAFNAAFARMAAAARVAEREHLFYSRVAPRLPPEVASRLPRVYHSSPAVLLMEDLAPRAEVCDQERGLSVAFAEKALRLAAGFHAPFWDRPLPACVTPGGDPSSWLSLIKQKSAALFAREGFLGGRGEPEDEAIGARLHAHADAIFSQATQDLPQTLIHADFRAGNLLREEKGQARGGGEESEECLVLDWQTFCAGSGLYDVASVVVCSMTVAERRRHGSRLLRGYQRELAARGVAYAWADLLRDFRLMVLQLAFCINYAFEGLTADDCPLLFTRARRRIMAAITDLDCLALFD